MPFQISPLLESDTAAFARAEAAAAENWPYAQAMKTAGTPRHIFVEEWARKQIGADKTVHWLKATDTETGELVGAALWKIPDGGAAEMGQADVPVQATALTPADKKADAGGIRHNGGSPDEMEDMGGNAALFASTEKMWRAFEAEYIGTRPYALLQLLLTHPDHQRRGAGTMLVRWGCERADAAGLMCALSSSAAGQKVYTQQGFEIVVEEEYDLKPYGVDAVEVRRRMIRPAKSAAR